MVALAAIITVGVPACSSHPAATAPAPAPAVAVATTSQSAPGPEPATRSAPARAAKSATLSRSTPVRLQIASIGLDSTLMRLGLRSDGSLQVPTGGFPAGWYTGGPTPGELGPAVIAGHVDMKGPGVFYRLHDIAAGDQIVVTRADGSTPVFRVTQIRQYRKDQFPSQLVYGNIDHAGLRLITCAGTFNSASGHYEDNLVVFADLVAAQP